MNQDIQLTRIYNTKIPVIVFGIFYSVNVRESKDNSVDTIAYTVFV